ncbi:hypothetical protein C8R46DRAFT_1082897 [Mycena filopes]|nr:hypothetical protein C8R46DRAFT_1082897 [Mycena filopes]
MKLGNHTDVQAAPVAGDDDLRRFMLDVSSAWNGQLALTPPDEDGASTNILPVYTLLPPAPAHPKPPVNPTSDPDSARDPPRNRARSMSSSSSISSFHGGRPQPQPSSTLSMSTPAVPASVFIPETTAASGTGHAFVSAPSPDDAEKNIPPVPVPPPPTSSSPLDAVRDFIRLWNERYFHPRGLEALVVSEGSFAEFAVKLVSRPHDQRSDTKARDSTSADPGVSWSTWQEQEEEEQ